MQRERERGTVEEAIELFEIGRQMHACTQIKTIKFCVVQIENFNNQICIHIHIHINI